MTLTLPKNRSCEDRFPPPVDPLPLLTPFFSIVVDKRLTGEAILALLFQF